MSNEEIVTMVEKGMETLNKGLSKMKQALSSANIAVGQEEAYNRGLQDAWELAKKIVLDVSKGGIPERDMRSMFGEKWTVSDILKNYTPQEAFTKLEGYEEKIEVGDVVERMNDGAKFLIITEEYDSSEYDFGVIVLQDMTIDRITGSGKHFKKTGKHIDIQSVLQQIGGGSNV